MSLMRMDGLKIPEQEAVGTIVLPEQRSVHMLRYVCRMYMRVHERARV